MLKTTRARNKKRKERQMSVSDDRHAHDMNMNMIHTHTQNGGMGKKERKRVAIYYRLSSFDSSSHLARPLLSVTQGVLDYCNTRVSFNSRQYQNSIIWLWCTSTSCQIHGKQQQQQRKSERERVCMRCIVVLVLFFDTLRTKTR